MPRVQLFINGECAVDEPADTIKQGRARAKYLISDEYRRAAEIHPDCGELSAMVMNSEGRCVEHLFA